MILDWVKVVAGLIGLANALLEWRKSRGDRMDGYQTAVAEGTAATLQTVGLSAKAFQERAGWTDEQIIDDLTKPPSPRSRP